MEVMSLIAKKYNDTNLGLHRDIFIKLISTLSISLLFSILIWGLLWGGNADLIHSVLEITSVCIGVAIFLILWSKRDGEYTISDVLGFGFLIVSIFDFMHTYYYKYFIVNDRFKGELSLRCWILARLIEVIILLIFSFFPYLKNSNKYLTTIKTTIIFSCLLYILYLHPTWFPVLHDKHGITEIKILLEYLVMAIAILVLFKLKKNLEKDNLVKFKDLYICILLIIPSEICLTLFQNSSSFWVVYGHLLKICSYYYLYKAIFQSLINYPYDKLIENNQRLSDILNAIPISIHTYNRDNKIDFVNEKFEALFKCPRENILGLNNTEKLNVLNNIKNECETSVYNNEKSHIGSVIKTYLDCKGQEVKVLVNTHKIKGGTLILESDVKQEQEIKNLNLQAQTILNSVTVPVMILDYNQNIIACNNVFANLVELDQKNIIQMNINELNHTLKFTNKEFINVSNIDNIANRIDDWLIETPKGNKKHIRANTSVIKNIYDEKIGVIFTIQDIEKIKEKQSKMMHQEKLALLGQMGATIVHETRNFLTTIKGNSQLIELYADNEKIKEYARKINRNTEEVNNIISDFLSLSKPREVFKEEIAVCDLLKSMEGTLETSSLIKGVEIEFIYNMEDRYVLCDKSQMKQVILNICKNAIEAMTEVKTPKLIIETGIIEDDNSIYIKVSDNGKGMNKETLKNIGTPFFTTKQSGTGLGLSVCYSILKEHGGYIDITSEEGKGTTFIIIIPCIEDDELEEIS